MNRLIDLSGKRFGWLAVIERAANRGGKVAWLCCCDCGQQRVIQGHHLKSGATKSCGCYRNEKTSERSLKHGQTIGQRTSEYKAWCGAKARCFNPNYSYYESYGGRGITMCPEWRDSFEAFFAYIGPRPEGLTLDRINNDGNYEPGNVHWATWKEQRANRRDVQRQYREERPTAL